MCVRERERERKRERERAVVSEMGGRSGSCAHYGEWEWGWEWEWEGEYARVSESVRTRDSIVQALTLSPIPKPEDTSLPSHAIRGCRRW